MKKQPTRRPEQGPTGGTAKKGARLPLAPCAVPAELRGGQASTAERMLADCASTALLFCASVVNWCGARESARPLALEAERARCRIRELMDDAADLARRVQATTEPEDTKGREAEGYAAALGAISRRLADAVVRALPEPIFTYTTDGELASQVAAVIRSGLAAHMRKYFGLRQFARDLLRSWDGLSDDEIAREFGDETRRLVAEIRERLNDRPRD